MPVVIKKSDNGFVDATRKLICLPSYLGLVGERRDALRRAAAVASATAAAAAFTLTSLPAQGDVVNLSASSPTVTAQINTGSSVGLDSLIINGTQQVNQQQVYFRTSATSGATASVSTLSQTSLTSSTSTLDVTYTGEYLSTNQFTIENVYDLNSQTNGAGMSFTVTAANKSSTSIPLTLVEYCDFDLNNTPNNDTIAFSGSPINTATQTDGGTGVTFQNQPSTPNPSSYEGELSNSTILNEITSPSFGHLSDFQPNPSTQGNVTYAFEWDTTLAPCGQSGSSESLSLNWTLEDVPEPASVSVAVMGLATMCGLRRPRRRGADAQL